MNWIERKVVEAAAMKWIKAHWGLVSSVVASAIVFLTPSLNAYAAHHNDTLAAALILALLKVAQEEKLIGGSK